VKHYSALRWVWQRGCEAEAKFVGRINGAAWRESAPGSAWETDVPGPRRSLSCGSHAIFLPCHSSKSDIAASLTLQQESIASVSTWSLTQKMPSRSRKWHGSVLQIGRLAIASLAGYTTGAESRARFCTLGD